MYSNFNQMAHFVSTTFSWGSDKVRDLFMSKFLNNLCVTDSSIVGRILGSISDILPVALSVAGAILVVNLGWRLFKNFTRG